MKLRIEPDAIERIEAARTWWIENREKAPYLFDDELADALELIAATPTAGHRIRLARGRHVRRVLMPKTETHVYYDVEDDVVIVLMIWGATRRRRPQLR